MKISTFFGKNEFEKIYFIRKKVFVDEQKFSLELEFDDIDEKAWHFLVEDQDKPIATARLFEKENKFHCGRIAVIKEYRGKNIGNLLMEAIHNKAKELKADEVYLSAQVRAKKFYEKNGYEAFGEVYLDEYCEHIVMKIKI